MEGWTAEMENYPITERQKLYPLLHSGEECNPNFHSLGD